MLNHQGTKTLKTNRFILRRFEVSDAQQMYRNWATDKLVVKYLTWQPHASVEFTKELLLKWVASYEQKTTYHWVIELNDNHEVIGSIAVHNLSENNKSCEIGYCLSRQYWGKGLMSEAAMAVIQFLFDEVGMNRIVAMHHPDNEGSGRVMIKNRMSYEGTLRQAGKSAQQDGFYDLKVYAILKSDWEKEC